MLGAHGVAAPDDHRVGRPGIAGLGPDLLFNLRQTALVYTAELRGFVFDAEQDEVAVVQLLAQEPEVFRILE